MAKATATNEREIDLGFPLQGLDETRAYGRQKPGTTVSCQNVRPFEPATGRARGGQRPSLTRYCPTQATTLAAIQDLNHFVSTSQPTPAVSGTFAYSQGSGNGFGIGNGSGGASLFAGLGAVSGYALACSCWGSASQVLYVAEVNTSTGTNNVNVYAINSDGTTKWGPVVLSCASGSLRNVAGMVVVGGLLFICIRTAASDAGNAQSCRIAQLNTATGGIIYTQWLTAGLYQGVASFFPLYFSTSSHNCIAAIGTTLGISVIGNTGNNPRLYLFSANPGPNAAALGAYTYTQTVQNNPTKVCSDGVGNFYVLADTLTAQVKKITVGGALAWQSTLADGLNGLTFDSKTPQLVILNAVSQSVRALDLALGQSFTNSVNCGGQTWNEIDTDGAGNFTLWKNGVASNDVMGISSTFSTSWGPSTLANATHSGASVFRGVVVQASPLAVRSITGIRVAGGTAEIFSSSGATAISGGAVFSVAAPVVFSAQNGLAMFFADGVSYHKYDGTQILAWTASNGGTLPTDPSGTCARLICTWRGRTVLAGLLSQPQNWFMSAQFDPLNFNYAPATRTATQAASGNSSLAGLVGDLVNCLCPYNDDTLILLCDHSIWQLTGDAMAGGQFDMVSDSIGGAWGRPYARDPFGQLYFFGSKCGVYKMTPGSLPVRISQQIEKRIESIDLSANIIRMAWDVQNQGLWIWVSPLNPLSATSNYFFDDRTQSWWVDVFSNTLHNPLCVEVFDGDTAADRVVLLGGRDGHVRKVDNLGITDDGTTVASSVVIGPLPNANYEDQLLHDLQATLGDASAMVTYSVYAGRTAESALASEPFKVGTWNAKRNHVSYINRADIMIYVKLSATAPWAIERITAKFSPQGMVRRRM